MKKTRRLRFAIQAGFALAFLALLLAACGSADTCTDDDYGCWLDHLDLADENGDSIELVDVPVSDALESAIESATSGFDAPSLSGFPTELDLFGADDYAEMTLDFTDPTAASKPSVCVCVHALKSSHYCAIGKMRCTKSVRDGLKKGKLKLQIGSRADTASSSPTDLGVTGFPMTPTTPGGEATDDATKGQKVRIGQPTDIPTKVQPPVQSNSDSSSSGGGCHAPGEVCASPSDCCTNGLVCGATQDPNVTACCAMGAGAPCNPSAPPFINCCNGPYVCVVGSGTGLGSCQ